MRSHRFAVSTLSLFALGSAVSAQDISIADANASFQIHFNTSRTTIYTNVVDFFGADPAGDAAGALFKSAWLYRTASDTREWVFNDNAGQAVFNSAGDTGTAAWADMDGLGLFSANLTYKVDSTGSRSGTVRGTLVVTNISASPLDLTLFHFADFDLCGAAYNQNTATSGQNRRQQVGSTCNETAEHYAIQPTRYESSTDAAGQDLYLRFQDAAITDLTSSNASIGPGDVRCAYQWRRVIAPGASSTFLVQMAHNHSTPQITINEFSYDDTSTDTHEFVELYNAGPGAAAIGGYTLSSADPSGANFSAAIPASTTLNAGDYYVIGMTAVPNVDLTQPFSMENDNESLTLADATGLQLDTLVYESWRGLWNPSLAEAEGIWGNQFLNEATLMTFGRVRDGHDTDNNGRDFVLQPWSPGTRNHGNAQRAAKDNYDTAAPGAVVADWAGSFTPVRVIDPTVVGPLVGTTPRNLNPNAIVASPQGGNCAIMWDESGGGNANVLRRAPGLDTNFEAYVYIHPNVRGTQTSGATEIETWSIGIQGTTDPFHNNPDPGQAIAPAIFDNGNTGVAWIYHANNASVTLYLVDLNDGGWTAGTAISDEQILAAIPITTTNGGWQRLLLDVTGTTLTARFGGTLGQPDGTLFTATVAPALGGVYLGYRELIVDNATTRPLTFDASCVQFCTGAGVHWIGTPTAHSAGTPTIGASTPALGGTLTIRGDGLLPNGSAFLVWGLELAVPIDIGALGGVAGSKLYVDTLATGLFTTDAGGSARSTKTIPADRALCGVAITWQWLQIDPALSATLPIAHTNALITTIGR